MKRKTIKIAALLTAMLIISGCLSALNFIDISADSANVVLFSENFDAHKDYSTNHGGSKTLFINDGWTTNVTFTNTLAGYADSGAFAVPFGVSAFYFTNTKASYQNHIIDCDINFAVTAPNAQYTTAILGGASDEKGTGAYGIKIYMTADNKIREIDIVNKLTIVTAGAGDVIKWVPTAANRPSVTGTTVHVTITFNNTDLTAKIKYGSATQNLNYTMPAAVSGYPSIYTNCSALTAGGVTYDNFTVSQPAADPEFNDDFEDGDNPTKKGWNYSSTYGTKANGKFTLNPGKMMYTMNVSGSTTWGDYALEGDVKLAEGTNTSTVAARIVSHATTVANNGYEFGLTVESAKSYLQLYKRGVSGGKINGKDMKFDFDVQKGTVYHLKLIISGSRIIAYCDDEQIFDVVDTSDPYTVGFAGIRSVGSELAAEFDNVVVRKVVADDLKYVYPEGYYYSDDFLTDTSLINLGWKSEIGAKDTKTGILKFPENTSNYLTGITDSDKWDNYTVEAKIALAEGEFTKNSAARIVARSTNTASNGYEYGVMMEAESKFTYLQLYKRGVSGGKINGLTYTFNVTALQGEYHDYKMVLSGNQIICYFDGMKVFNVIDESEPFTNGYAGVRSIGTTASSIGFLVDSIDVRETVSDDIVIDEKLKQMSDTVWIEDNFNAESALSDRGWSTDEVSVLNGKVSVIGAAYTSEIQDASNWTDYEVSADVIIDKTGGLAEGVTVGNASICIRSHGTTTGYEYGIISRESGVPALRLYDRKNATTIASVSKPLSDGTHTLRITCLGNLIRCYCDGELVINVNNDVAKDGYAGIRASGFTTYYDNFKVGLISKEESGPEINNNGEKESPLTGIPAVVYKVIAPVLFIVSLLSLIALFFAVFYNKKNKTTV